MEEDPSTNSGQDKKEEEHLLQIILNRSGRGQSIRPIYSSNYSEYTSATRLIITILVAAPLIECVR